MLHPHPWCLGSSYRLWELGLCSRVPPGGGPRLVVVDLSWLAALPGGPVAHPSSASWEAGCQPEGLVCPPRPGPHLGHCLAGKDTEPNGPLPPRDEGPPTPGSATKGPPVRAWLWEGSGTRGLPREQQKVARGVGGAGAPAPARCPSLCVLRGAALDPASGEAGTRDRGTNRACQLVYRGPLLGITQVGRTGTGEGGLLRGI